MIFDRPSDTSNDQAKYIKSTHSSCNSSPVQPVQFVNPYDTTTTTIQQHNQSYHNNKSIDNNNNCINNNYVIDEVNIGTLSVSNAMLDELQHQLDNEYITDSIDYIKLQYRESMHNIVCVLNEKLRSIHIDVSNHISNTAQHTSARLSQHKRVSTRYNKLVDVSSEQSSDNDEYIPPHYNSIKKRRNAVIHHRNSKTVLPAVVNGTERAEKQKFDSVDLFSTDHILTTNNKFGDSIIDEVMNSDNNQYNIFNCITNGN